MFQNLIKLTTAYHVPGIKTIIMHIMFFWLSYVGLLTW